MNLLGISAFYHDSAAALIVDGDVRYAAQEERFTRKKHDCAYPKHAIDFCLKASGKTLAQIDYVVFYEKPFLKFERLLETYLAFAPRGFASFRKSLPVWLNEKLFQKNGLIKQLKALEPNFDWEKKLLFSEHHLSHAASAFFPSPFEEAAVLTMDGVGEWATTSVSVGKGNHLSQIREIRFPHSLGLLYSAFTYFLGFKPNSGEYKVMGLAPYGEPRFVAKILENLVDIKADGSFRLNLDYFDYCTGLTMTNSRFADLFGVSRRSGEIEKIHQDLAASVQAVTEEIVLRLARSVAAESGSKNLCLAGGVALNCVANGKVLKENLFERIWVQPAAGDAGGAIGAALAAYHLMLGEPRTVQEADGMQSALLGPSYSNDEVETALKNKNAKFHVLAAKDIDEKCAAALAQGKAVGWFQGPAEFGPRALGARSILADPRSPTMQKQLNQKIKFRESFRPFAPSVLAECAQEWFELETESPYMLFTARAKTKNLPAVTHVDASARVQTVSEGRFHSLLEKFQEKTGCPVLVNTSFNVRGEPMVGSPEDAFRCFMGTDLDVLAIQNCLLLKEEQAAQKIDYRETFEPD